MASIAMHNNVRLEDAVNSLSLLIQKVMSGEEVFITQNQKPIAKLVAVSNAPAKPRKLIEAGSAKGLIKIADDFDAPLEDFRDVLISESRKNENSVSWKILRAKIKSKTVR